MGKFKEMDLLRQEREAFDADYPMEPTPRADMWIAWNSEDGFTFWDNEQQATLWSSIVSNEWPVQYVMQKCTPLSAFVRSSEEDKAEVMERVIDKAIEEQNAIIQTQIVKDNLQSAPVQEPVAWRYTDARGHYRYRGYVPGFDAEYQLLKPEALCLCTPSAAPAKVQP
jgi:hypothetical protein